MYVAKTPHHTQIVEKNMYNTGLPADKAIKCKQVAELYGRGMTTDEACKQVGIGIRMWYRYEKEYPRVAMWMELAKDKRIRMAEDALFSNAIGRSCKKKKIYKHEKNEDGDVVRVLDCEIEEVLPPDTAAQKYYLNNVAPKEWADKGEPSTGSQVIINMPAVTIGGKPMQFDCGVVDAEVVNE